MPFKDKEKNKEYFRKYRIANRDILNTRCREWVEQNYSRFIKSQKLLRLKIKLLVFSHYSDGKLVCACCGENQIEFLSIDHIKGRKNDLLRGAQLYWRLRREGYPSGYQVLCFNCNQAKGIYGECPHARNK